MPDLSGLTGPKVNITLQAMQAVAKEEAREMISEQVASKSTFQEECEDIANPFAATMKKAQKSIEANKGRLHKLKKSGEAKERIAPLEAIKDSANKFQQRNPELKQPTLILLRERIKEGSTKEDILKALSEFYEDPSLADEALEFLLETTDGELAETVRQAREEFVSKFGREILAGRNISQSARDAAAKGLGSPTSMRDLYRNVTETPKDSTTLFQELSQKYAFKDMKKVVDFLLHSLGADMKSKGPSIPRGQLHRLLTETRSLQAILGVYRFFRSRMGLVSKMFIKEGLDLPEQLNFESLTKQFMSLCGERYPTSDKVLQTAVRLGIEKWIQAKIIALSQMRDAIREVALNQIYRSLQHRDELYLAILEALEDLEDELEELLEKEEEEEGEGEEEEEEKEEEEKKKKEKEAADRQKDKLVT